MINIISNLIYSYSGIVQKNNEFNSIENYLLKDYNFLRYSKQLFLKELDFGGQQKLQKSTVLIVGLGGTGSPAALYLAAAGIGNIILADNDRIDITNLQRQILYRTNDIGKYKAKVAVRELKKLNPECNYNFITKRLTGNSLSKQILKSDLVLDCSDNVNTHHEINKMCIENKVSLISGSATSFNGQLLIIFPSTKNFYGCYACLYPDNKEIHYNCDNYGILGPIVGLIGTLQALEAIKMLSKMNNRNIKNKNGNLYLFDGKTLSWRTFFINRNPECKVCANLN